MSVEPSNRVYSTHLQLAITGTIVLVGVCVTTLWIAVTSPAVDDPCALIDKSGTGDSFDCSDPAWAGMILLTTPAVVGVLGTIATWLPSVRYRRYVPHGWVPYAGLALVIIAWFVAEWLAPGSFF